MGFDAINSDWVRQQLDNATSWEELCERARDRGCALGDDPGAKMLYGYVLETLGAAHPVLTWDTPRATEERRLLNRYRDALTGLVVSLLSRSNP